MFQLLDFQIKISGNGTKHGYHNQSRVVVCVEVSFGSVKILLCSMRNSTTMTDLVFEALLLYCCF